MISAIAIDDEPLALKIIENFCAQYDKIKLLATFTQTTEAAVFLAKEKVDLLLLDINMPSVSGIDFYKQLERQPMLIFTTAYSEFAVEGFNLNAADYLLKPFTYKRFVQAAEKVIAQNALGGMRLNKTEPFLTIRADYSLIKILLKDIVFIESLDNYVKIHLQNQKPILARMPMKTIIELLPANTFVRTHRSYIVPINQIKSIRNKTAYLQGYELPIGNSFEKDLLERFTKGNL